MRITMQKGALENMGGLNVSTKTAHSYQWRVAFAQATTMLQKVRANGSRLNVHLMNVERWHAHMAFARLTPFNVIMASNSGPSASLLVVGTLQKATGRGT
jgi:hypothetical protein